jgi:hypothetical protein
MGEYEGNDFHGDEENDNDLHHLISGLIDLRMKKF